MAYIDFAPATGGMIRETPVSTVAPRHDPVPSSAGGLSPLEWSVVAIARGDGIASLRSPGRMAIALGSLFGSSRSPRLADPKLETLRRVAVLGWHHGFALPGDAADAFLAAGYTADQYQTMLASIEAARTKRKPRR
jgi:hypothetical protein